MKFTAATLIAACIATVTARMQLLYSNQLLSTTIEKNVAQASSKMITNEPTVGANDLSWKSCGSPEDILQIESVEYEPKVPVRGQQLTVHLKGQLFSVIDQGTKVNLNVKWGFIRVPVPPVDVCDQLHNLPADVPKCPLQPGAVDVTQSFVLPKEIPDGKFDVNIRIKDQNQRQVTCIQALLTL